jgi:hypothetical protein
MVIHINKASHQIAFVILEITSPDTSWRLIFKENGKKKDVGVGN